MSDFRYDDYEEDQQEQQQVTKNQEQFQKNYTSLMKQHEEPQKQSQIQPPKIVQKQNNPKEQPKKQSPPQLPIQQPSKKQQIVKKDDAKKPPLPQPSNNASTKSKLVDQHLKLKSQLKQLATKMDEIVEKQKQKRRRKLNINAEEEDQRIVQLRNELKSQEIQINRNKLTIDKLRKNLDFKYDIHKIVQKQDELKLLKAQVLELQKQKKYLQKINKQEKTQKGNQDKQLREKYDKMKAQISDLTQKNKKHIQSINERQKQIRKLHENYVVKQSKIKQIQVKLNSKKQTPQNDDLQYTISQLQDSIKQLTIRKKQIQTEGQQRLKELEKQKKRLKKQAESRRLYLQEKQKELKINKIQYQDIVRLINSANMKPKKQINDDNVSKISQKRKVNKGGRQRPKIPKNEEEDMDQIDQTKSIVRDEADDKQKQSVGVGSVNNDGYDDYTNAEFQQQVK